MSRIGNTPITIPKDTTVTMDRSSVVVTGPKGERRLDIPSDITVKRTDDVLAIGTKGVDKRAHALHGFFRAELANVITGVTKGWTKTLELSGVGFRASLDSANIVLTIGFSHTVTVVPPAGITFSLEEGKIIIFGTDKQLVGQTAAGIREMKKPEPYKGKGIKYLGERIRKKAGKSAKAIGTGAAGAGAAK